MGITNLLKYVKQHYFLCSIQRCGKLKIKPKPLEQQVALSQSFVIMKA